MNANYVSDLRHFKVFQESYFNGSQHPEQCMCWLLVLIIFLDRFRLSSAEATGAWAPCQAIRPVLYGTQFRHKDYCSLRG